jgi:hypothetical protein
MIIALQSDEPSDTIAWVRTSFDLLVQKYQSMALQLTPNARVVHNPAFK